MNLVEHIDFEEITLCFRMDKGRIRADISITNHETRGVYKFSLTDKIWLYLLERDKYNGFIYMLAWLNGTLPDKVLEAHPELNDEGTAKSKQEIVVSLKEQGFDFTLCSYFILGILDM